MEKRTIQEIKNAVAQEHDYLNWRQLVETQVHKGRLDRLGYYEDIAMRNYGYVMRRNLVHELAKSLRHLPEVITLIEETEFRAYPED
jgi:hypothetical protein